mmetsp:Transcript_82955/g.161548  ORF Transcript_82955/g.161548 Transcript_82955/m.161548 type:complete len:99 (+) Transcript_82955:782-1078(+)
MVVLGKGSCDVISRLRSLPKRRRFTSRDEFTTRMKTANTENTPLTTESNCHPHHRRGCCFLTRSNFFRVPTRDSEILLCYLTLPLPLGVHAAAAANIS